MKDVNQLTGTIPTELGRLTSLIFIDLGKIVESVIVVVAFVRVVIG
jgi:hypothetical protein